MTDDRFSDLRLFPGLRDQVQAASEASSWEALGQLYEQATGFPLPVSPEGPVRTDQASPPAEPAARLATWLCELVEQRAAALDALRQREAELATAIPVVLRRGSEIEMAGRLEAVLRDAAAMLDCFAAAIYMLDDDTSELKLRVGWGLPRQRLVEAARPLRGAISDLEAMLGHIVLLDDTARLPHWRSPERAAAAACVPLSSSSTPLGTLWFFADRPRSFDENDGRLLEIVAGRVVAELEREAVTRQRVLARRIDTQLGRARQWQDNRLPVAAEPLAGWEMAGWAAPAERVGGDFHGWQALPSDHFAVWLGHAHGGLLEAALTAANLQGALAMCLGQTEKPSAGGGSLLESLNRVLWKHSTGDERASLACATVDGRDGRMRFAAAGDISAMLVRGEGTVELPPRRDALGVRRETAFPEAGFQLQPGDVLLLASDGVQRVSNREGERFELAAAAELLREHRGLSARQLLDHARLLLQADDRNWTAEDCTFAIVRRTP